MINKNVLCCVNDNPIFLYKTLVQENNEQIILNFLTTGNPKKWIKKEKTNLEEIEFVYYEINIEKAFHKILTQKRYRKHSIESFSLSFLNYFLEETPEKLINFLNQMSPLTEEEIKDLKLEFQKINA